jgi:molecular chaperone GrpE
MSERQTHDQKQPSEQETPEPDPLEEARARIAQLEDGWRRAAAELDNFRKRCAKDLVRAREQERARTTAGWLPVVDNLERALASAEESEQHLAEGVRLVHSELIAVLERNGVEQFDPSGERFDPAEHEALSMRNQGGSESGVVLDVVEKGYRANGTVLRPARVVVSS